MKFKFILFYGLVIFGFDGLLAQETFKLMFYNLLNFPLQDVPANRIDHLEIILSDYQPDLFMVCELNNEVAANDIYYMMKTINENYSQAAFVLNTSDDLFGDQNDLQNFLYYDNTKFTLESQTEITTIYRDFNHYRLKLNTIQQTSNPIYIDAIVCHLKASSGIDNETLRFQMILDLQAYLNTLPSNSNVILAGDFNFYTSSEFGFQELIHPTNNIVFTDPANRIGSWHNNSSFVDVFTQSTRTQNELDGATGGFDDRFDFILTSQNLITNTDLHYVADSYKVFGNNANTNCFNRAINSNECGGSNYSASIREALYNFSDHLPVTIQLATDQTLSINEFVNLQAVELIDGNIIDHTLQLKLNTNFISNQTLNVYDSIGKLIKTINTKNSIYIDVDTSMLANGLYYIVSPQISMKPLKFVIAH